MGRSRSCNLIADRPHVSIQLVSPASGEISKDAIPLAPEYIVSIQLVSPASGEMLTLIWKATTIAVGFPFN